MGWENFLGLANISDAPHRWFSENRLGLHALAVVPRSVRATWYLVFQQYTLPVDLTCLKLHEPVFIGNHSVRIVMSVEPYLKREQEMTAVAVLSGQ